MPAGRETRMEKVKALAAEKMKRKRSQENVEPTFKKKKASEMGGGSSQLPPGSPPRAAPRDPSPETAAEVPPPTSGEVPAASHHVGSSTANPSEPFLRASSRIFLGVNKEKGSSSSSLLSAIFHPSGMSERGVRFWISM